MEGQGATVHQLPATILRLRNKRSTFGGATNGEKGRSVSGRGSSCSAPAVACGVSPIGRAVALPPAFQELDESWVICGLRRERQVQACQQKPVNRGSDPSLEPKHREAVSAG